MYDPTIGRWISEDPIGFEAADPNLYRYVGNNPTNATDPSGLIPAPYGTLPFWRTEPRSQLNISGSTDATFVRRAIASLDTHFPLRTIPVLTPNSQAPAFSAITPDAASRSPRTMNGGGVIVRPIATPAQRARINIRANLLNLKQRLVDGIYNMLVNNPPELPPVVPRPGNDDYARAANQAADIMIRATDEFLRTHPGARPSLRARNGVADFFGISNPENAPWCGDWAPAMRDAIHQGINSGQADSARLYLRFDPAQAYDPGWPFNLEHNFIIVRPAGHQTQFSRPGNDFVDPVILLFDPWRELIPAVYRPSPWSEQPRRTPTNLFPRQEQLRPGRID